MIRYFRALAAPSHLSRAYLELRSLLAGQNIIRAYPPLAYFFLDREESPLDKKLYLEDRLGPGGLIMDSWSVAGGVLYWSSSRWEDLKGQLPAYADGSGDPILGCGLVMGLLTGDVPERPKPINWKKASSVRIEIDFDLWPDGVSWKEL